MDKALLQPLDTLPKVGSVIFKQLKILLSHNRIIDLLFHIPYRIEHWNIVDSIAQAPSKTPIILSVIVERYQWPFRGRRRIPIKIYVSTKSGELLQLIFFHGSKPYIEQTFPLNKQRYIYGSLEMNRTQMIHPEAYSTIPSEFHTVYTTGTLSRFTIERCIQESLRVCTQHFTQDWLNKDFLQKEGWKDFATTLHTLHNPKNLEILSPNGPYIRRLAYDELLSNQLALRMEHIAHERTEKMHTVPKVPDLIKSLESLLPFQLTHDQKKVINEIQNDMHNRKPMLRLIQGDVGSGKTVVTFAGVIIATKAHMQSALMTPTEVLAQQHFTNLVKLAQPYGIQVGLLTQSTPAKNRKKLLNELKNGKINLIVGTHALFQKDVYYHNLGFVIVDEQHRFGVSQREALINKGTQTDILYTTATPIPRTLTLALYGDLDHSYIYEKPAFQQRIKTLVVSTAKLQSLLQMIQTHIPKGEQIFWVCPRITKDEEDSLMSVEERVNTLSAYFGAHNVRGIHGQMKKNTQMENMNAFIHKDFSILVSTTVIEVGVDIPNTTVMVIENAERFGMAQLHQLRGRIGRGSLPSTCVLMYKTPLSVIAKKRLSVLRHSSNGFLIAEQDLALRGGGEMLGTRQSGFLGLHFADLSLHYDLLKKAYEYSTTLLKTDPTLCAHPLYKDMIALYLPYSTLKA